jgi:N-methylhydantoinase B/oxoprolinase/acetone carboxylase alpha subunit
MTTLSDARTEAQPSASLKERLLARERHVQQTGVYEPNFDLKEQDPIRFEILFTKALQAVMNAREVGRLVSASPVTRELGEIVFGLYTPEGDAVCLSNGLMLHVRTMSRMIKWMIRNDYEERVGFRPGDFFFNNDPYIGGSHGPDQMLVCPIFYEGNLIGWAGGLTHVLETGSVEPGGMGVLSASRFSEGLFLPCLRVAENDELLHDLEVLVDRNVRESTSWLLDNRAKFAGARMIRERVVELCDEFGVDHYTKAIYEFVEDSLRASRETVRRRLFPGVYREVSWRGFSVNGRDLLLHAPVEITVNPDGTLVLDWEGMSSAGDHPFQSTLPCFEAILFNAMIQYVFFDTRYNEGTFQVVELRVPEGSACNPPHIFHATAQWGPAFGGGIVAGQALARAYYAMGYREEVHASNAACMGMMYGGIDQYGRRIGGWNMEFSASGTWAQGLHDGLDTALAEFNAEGDMGDAEIWERTIPIVYLGRTIHRDGGGFGKFRGGAGIHSIYFVKNSKQIEVGSFGVAPIHSTPGLMGGYPAPVGYARRLERSNLRDVIKRRDPLPHDEGDDPGDPLVGQMLDGSLTTYLGGAVAPRQLDEYDVWIQSYGDGGGFGDPLEREVSLIARDLENGVTTRRSAERVYGVVFNDEGGICPEATTQRRQAMRTDRLARGKPAQAYRRRTRERILAGDYAPHVGAMLADVFAISPTFREKYVEYWDLPADFEVER